MTERSGFGVWRAFAALAGGAAAATCVWLFPAIVAITSWPARGPVRVALLLPAWQLGVALVAGIAVGTLALLLRRGVRALALCNWLWLWALPFVPWIPDRFPLLLVLSGPVRWAIPAVIAARLLVETAAWRRSAALLLNASRRTVFIASLVIYLACGFWATATQGVIGDEPHYLIISQSLLEDGDIQIENNHRQRDYQSYFGGDLRPDFMTRGKNGEIYSIHAPGLPALAAPAYAIGGRRGVVLFIAVLASLAALAIFDLALLVTTRTAAVLTWLGVCMTVPFVPYSWAIFPEMPGALLVAWAALWLWQDTNRSWQRWLLRGLALAALPWLHTKFSVFLAAFGAAHAFRLRRQPRELIAFLSAPAISGVLWLYSFYSIYGVFDPEAPYGHYADTYILTRYIPHGLIGMFFDQKFGLFFYSPLYLTAFAGAWILWRDRRSRLAVGLIVFVVSAFVVSTARLYMFWGGASAPARFLVPVAACLAPLVAAAIGAARTPMARALVGMWLAVGLTIAALATLLPDRLLLYSDPHGQARILEIIEANAPLALVMPTFTDPDWASHLLPLAAWIAGALAALGVLALLARRVTTSWAAAVVASVVFLAVGIAATTRPSAAVRAETARRGAVVALTNFDGSRYRTVDYQRLSRATPERWQELTTIAVPFSTDQRTDAVTSTSVTLPPGRYEARVWFDGGRTRQGSIQVEGQDQVAYAKSTGPLANPTTIGFTLEFEVRRLSVRVEEAGDQSTTSRIEIVPISVTPPARRPPYFIRAVEAVRDWPNGYIAYTDEDVYPEHGMFWTRGTVGTTVLIVPGGASRLTLHLSTGPMRGAVTVEAMGQTREIEMTPGQGSTVSFDVPPGTGLLPLRIRSSTMFRPGEVDPAIRDMRGLGCQVLVVLE